MVYMLIWKVRPYISTLHSKIEDKNAMERNQSGKLAREWWGCGSQMWWYGKELTERGMFSQILKEIAVANYGDTWESNTFWQKEHQIQRL